MPKSASYMKRYRKFSKTAKGLGVSINDAERITRGGATDAEARAIVQRMYRNRGSVAERNRLYNRLTGRGNSTIGPYS